MSFRVAHLGRVQSGGFAFMVYGESRPVAVRVWSWKVGQGGFCGTVVGN